MKRTIKIGIVIVVLSAVGVLASYAARVEENDALASRQGGISLIQAVRTAEQLFHGKAVRAEFDGWVFDVEVVADNNKTYDVMVDPATGNILNAQEVKDGDGNNYLENE